MTVFKVILTYRNNMSFPYNFVLFALSTPILFLKVLGILCSKVGFIVMQIFVETDGSQSVVWDHPRKFEKRKHKYQKFKLLVESLSDVAAFTNT